jgi:hypothetical protein
MSNIKIKEQYLTKTVKVYDRILGSRTIVVAKIDMNKIAYYQSIGLGYLFEEVTTTAPEEVKVINYQAVDGPIPAETPKPKKKRTKKPATDANS